MAETTPYRPPLDAAKEAVQAVWLDGYDVGREHGVKAVIDTFRQVMAANEGRGLSPEATEAVFSAILDEISAKAAANPPSTSEGTDA